MFYSDGGVVDNLVDTADSDAITHADLDVTFVTPGRGPGVTDDIVALISLITVTNGEDGVVNLGGAVVGGGEDTAGVSLEDFALGVDGDTDGLLLNGSLDAVGVSADLLVASSIGDTLGLIVAARALGLLGGTRDVGVVSLAHGHVSLLPLPAVVVHATIAAVVGKEALRAINELLRGHNDLLVASNDVSGLNSLSGGESPA